MVATMTASRTVELEGHIIDSGMMQRAFEIVMDMGGSFHVEEFTVGTRKDETSYCRMAVSADDEGRLQSILHELHQNGANIADPVDADLVPAPADRVVPRGFYSTTNHPTEVRHDGAWLAVEDIEMDCAIVVENGDEPRVTTRVLNAIRAGDLVGAALPLSFDALVRSGVEEVEVVRAH